ncbi:hypothetical protein CU098_004851, partial [Rhizopus stolonifer]
DYKDEAKVQQVFSTDTMHDLFGNLEALIKFQRMFLVKIEAQAACSKQEQNFGQIFIDAEEKFTVYEPFCANFQIIQDLVIQESHKLQKLAHIMSPDYELPAMLIKPVQRLCKYPLLLQQLIKSTPEDWCYAEINKKGLEAMERVTKNVNETKRIQENSMVIQDLKKKIVVEDGTECLLDKFGSLLLHDKLILQKADSEHTKEMAVFLFQKVILMCKEVKDVNKNSISIKKRRKEGTLIVRGRVPMSRIDHVKGYSNQIGQHILNVTWNEKDVNQTIQLKCRNDELLKQWLNTIIEIKASSKVDLLPATPQTPFPEINPMLNYYDDDEDDYYSSHNQEEETSSAVVESSQAAATRLRSHSYQHRSMPQELSRQPSLGSTPNGYHPPRSYMNGIPGVNLPPLPRSPTRFSTSTTEHSQNHSLPYSPPVSHPSSPDNNTALGALWQRRQQQRQTDTNEPVYERRSRASNLDIQPTTSSKRNSNQDIPEDYIKIKTHYQGSIYVVLVPSSIDYVELSRRIKDKLKLCVQEPSISITGLKYEDEDGDLITINSDEDVQMGFEVKGRNNVVNFHVTAVC